MDFLNVFASVDTDQDLVIHESDLDAYAAKMKYEKAFTRKWLLLFDQNGDGKITFTEFCDTLGLDEKIYEDKLREIRLKLKEKEEQPKQESRIAARRANRAKKSEEEQVEEDQIQAKSASRARSAMPPPVQEKEVEEEIERPKAKRGVQTKPPVANPDEIQVTEENKPEYHVEIIDGVDYSNNITVEYSELQQSELDKVQASLNACLEQSEKTKMSNADFDRSVTRRLERSLGHGWRCQTNAAVSHREISHAEGCIAVLLVPGDRRVLIWKLDEAAAGCCCCC